MAKRLSRIERDIERFKEKISEYQQQLKELEAAKGQGPLFRKDRQNL